jgi:hypothetical protein
VCGGTCPNPADSCVASTIPGQPCTCVPPPCHQDPVTGACSGTCATGAAPGTCHLSANGCVCGPPPCSIDPASGQCGGPCPNGGICGPDSANNCTCLQPCAFNAASVCGGACPPGTACQVMGQECLCAPPQPPQPRCNFGAETANFCSGFCPPGQVCKTLPTTSGNLSCTCVNN